ncbi:MAG: hypothetical protein ACFB10_26670 [Salibacteraceae bacterium]
MKSNLVLFLLFFVLAVPALGQDQVTITIDSNCFSLYETPSLDGTFGLYGFMKIDHPPFWVNDTLLQELDFVGQQHLTLAPGSYVLRFTPNDSNKKVHEHPFYPSHKNIYLDGFFFYQPYPSVIRDMKNHDFVVFSSSYFGPTNMATMVSYYTLTLKKKGGHLYALYSTYQTNEQGMLLREQIPALPYDPKQVKLTKEYRKLTEKEVQVLLQFERDLSNLVISYAAETHFIVSKSYILSKRGYSSFLTKGYMSTILWDQLNPTGSGVE